MVYKRIRDLREDKDIKQRELAKILDVDQSTYSDYENGETNISINSLIKLAQFYETSIDYMVGKTDEKEPYPRKDNNQN